MGDQFKLDTSGTCTACNVVAPVGEHITCFICKEVFHCACASMGEDDRPGTKSLVTAFCRASTKRNFQFFCDVCLTKCEIDMINSEGKRLKTLENTITLIVDELSEMKKLLKERDSKPAPAPAPKLLQDNIWFNKERLAATKVAPAEPILVVDNIQNESSGTVEKAIVEHSIPVTKTYKNNSGGLVLVCDTQDSRDKLKDAIASTTENVRMKSASGKKPSVTIVGLSREYSKDEVIKQIVSQNQFVKHFSTVNKIEEHIEIHDIKPTKSKETVFQAFASVSEPLRKGFRNYRDKVTIGLTSCKIYDRYHVKRCNNCQGLGHYYKDCTTPDATCCAKFGENHATSSCNSSVKRCVNCVKAGKEESGHTAFDPKCPIMVGEVEKKKKSNETSLNYLRATMAHL